MDNDTLIDADPGTDKTRMLDARDGVIWDPRADMDDDGDVDDDDVLLWSDADNVWPESEPTVAQAFSDVGNPFMFQGVPHFALDTADDAETATLPLNHHRARFADPVTGRWGARDPNQFDPNLFLFVRSNTLFWLDPVGLDPPEAKPPPRILPFKTWVIAATIKLKRRPKPWELIGLATAHCVSAVLAELGGNFPPGPPTDDNSTSWGFIHCVSHCAITKHCVGGSGTSEVVGIATELLQIAVCKLFGIEGECQSAWQASDWWDNAVGRECAGAATSCAQCCADRLGGTTIKELPEGEHTARPFGPFGDPPGPWSPPGGEPLPPWWGRGNRHPPGWKPPPPLPPPPVGGCLGDPP